MYQCCGNHCRQGEGGEQLRQRRHGGRGSGGFHGQPLQRFAELAKATQLRTLRRVEANITVRHHVFLDDIGQTVGRILVIFGEPVQAFRQDAHDGSHRWEQQCHDQGEFPVQVHQISHQCQQRQTVTCQRHQRVDQQNRARLHFVDQRIGKCA